MSNIRLAERIRKWRESSDLSQEAFAKLMQLSRSYIGNIEVNSREPNQTYIENLANVVPKYLHPAEYLLIACLSGHAPRMSARQIREKIPSVLWKLLFYCDDVEIYRAGENLVNNYPTESLIKLSGFICVAESMQERKLLLKVRRKDKTIRPFAIYANTVISFLDYKSTGNVDMLVKALQYIESTPAPFVGYSLEFYREFVLELHQHKILIPQNLRTSLEKECNVLYDDTFRAHSHETKEVLLLYAVLRYIEGDSIIARALSIGNILTDIEITGMIRITVR